METPNKDLNYTEINGRQYFRFSGRIDVIHLHADHDNPLYKSTGSICGKPSLSSNYAQQKPDEKYCEECMKLANRK